MRVILVLLLPLWASSIWIYLLLWICVPEARTTAQKLEMRGETPTVDNIRRAVEEEHTSGQSTGSSLSSTAGEIFRSIFKIFFIVIGGIMEHVEECGVHSGDAACVLPPWHLSEEIKERIVKISEDLAIELDVKGLMNVQLAVKDNDIYLIEVNPRAARTVPFVSKATSLPLAKIAARIMTGKSLAEQGVTHQIVPPYYSVKEVVLPFHKFPGSDPILGPEMRSTGEVMGTAPSFHEAYAKAQLAANSEIVRSGRVLLSIRNSDKKLLPELGRKLIAAGFALDATGGTFKTLDEAGIAVTRVKKVYEGRPNILDGIKSGHYSWIINTTEGRQAVLDSRSLRRGALQYHVSYCTTINAAIATVDAMNESEFRSVHSIQELHQQIAENEARAQA